MKEMQRRDRLAREKYRTPTHMAAVQRLATARNGRAEILVDFVLRVFATELYDAGRLARFHEPKLQKVFVRDDCNDRFDHFLELDLAQPVGSVEGPLQIWGQTTCYKGNKSGKPEPNKTYEIRETLVEALSLRRWLREEGISFRTVHFTVGQSNYTYPWFRAAKDRSFDLSIYPKATLNTDVLFDELDKLINSEMLEDEMYDQFRSAMGVPGSQTGEFIQTFLGHLRQWLAEGFPTSPLADQQADLLSALRQTQVVSLSRALSDPRGDVADIKKRAEKVLQGADTDDVLMVRTLQRLMTGKPFLSAALKAGENWASWSSSHFADPNEYRNLEEYVTHLWSAVGSDRLIIRRLLLRIHADQGVNYVQDTDIAGLSEHNLYGGEHSQRQTQEMVMRIALDCRKSGINTPQELFDRLVSKRGLKLLKDSQQFEVRNGTTMTPSFFYLEEALSSHYDFVPFEETLLPLPVGYHATFGSATVNSYDNMKVIVGKHTRRPVAVIRAKFFRQQEFGRRAKEDAYVGLTTRFQYMNGVFEERYPGIPLILFVDMESTCEPLEYAITRLITAGWEVCWLLSTSARKKASSLAFHIVS
jgi:hypothetical protein